LAELFNPKFLHTEGLIKNGMISNKHFFSLWSNEDEDGEKIEKGVVSRESVPKLLHLMELLQISFTKPEEGKSFDQLTTFVPFLFPVEVPPNYETIWPNAAQSSFPIEKSLVYFFNFLPREFISRLLSLLLQEFYDCKSTALWHSGGVFSGASFKLLVRLESQKHKIVIEDQSLQVSKAPSGSSLKTQLLVIHARATDEEAGFQAMQSVFKLVNKIKESYLGIRSWQLTRHCSLHDGGECAGLVDMTKQPSCISTNEPFAAKTVKQLRVACGLEIGDGLCFQRFLDSHSQQIYQCHTPRNKLLVCLH
jgi:hypothetical protein